VDEAFVRAFRIVVLAAAGLAALAGVTGWRMIEPARPDGGIRAEGGAEV
jgi:hypothetical protein